MFWQSSFGQFLLHLLLHKNCSSKKCSSDGILNTILTALILSFSECYILTLQPSATQKQAAADFSQASPSLLLDTLHRTWLPAFHWYRCCLAYLEDSNATGRNCRVSYCRFSDTTLYSQGNSESGIYAAEHSLLAGDYLCHSALHALRSTAL